MSEQISNEAAEEAVLSGIFQHGLTEFNDVGDLLRVDSIASEYHQIIFKCLSHILKDTSTVDLPSIISTASELGFHNFLENDFAMDNLKSICKSETETGNIRANAIKVKKLEIARTLRSKIKDIQRNIYTVTGEETVDEIIGIVEAPIFNLTNDLGTDVEKPKNIGESVEDYIRHLEDNPSEMIGVSSGFPRYDAAIGGGFRRKCVDLIAARPKVGKSVFAENVAIHASHSLNIPVLMLDTEMSKEDNLNRMLANFSGVSINDISSGKFSEKPSDKEKVKKAADLIKDIPISYISIAGKAFEETLSIMRRWIIQNVGYDSTGRVNDCLIVYDYLKLMTPDKITNNMQEFQVLGFQITALHNFCVQYDCPCLSFVQLNRDGITKESTDTVSGSDRLIWLCTSFSIFKNKSIEEIEEDDQNNNKKLVPIVSRHGPGLEDGDYINIAMIGDTARIIENETRNELKVSSRTRNQGFASVEEDSSTGEISF